MGDNLRENEGKAANDLHWSSASKRCVWVPGAVIVGAGPSGLAAAACLKDKGVPSFLIERSKCIASLWQLKTYDRLRLHLPKKFCELPLMSFPLDFPMYPSRQQFVTYLEAYAKRFEIQPVFERAVTSAEYDRSLGFWRVRTAAADGSAAGDGEVEYVCRWLIAATGENAEAVVPVIEGAEEFGGEIVHTSFYRSGSVYKGKKVLVVGCGNSGMEVCLDLCNHKANPSLVVRDTVHILPRDVLGRSTFGLSMWLLKWLPVRIVDRFLLVVSWLILGDTGRVGLERPKIGPLELKHLCGKTPVLDVGTLEKIRSGHIKVRPSIERLRQHSVEFSDGSIEEFDVILLATGFRSNVPCWLKENEMFSEKDGFPKKPFSNGWKGKDGLYAAGFTKRGLFGSSMDSRNIADDISRCWNEEANHLSAVSWPFSIQKHI